MGNVLSSWITVCTLTVVGCTSARVEQPGLIRDLGPTHPRIYLSPARVDMIRAAAETPSVLTEAWNDVYVAAQALAHRLSSGTDTTDPVTAHPFSLIGNAKLLALAYLVTGDEQFLAAALVYGQMLIDTDPVAGNDYTSAGRIEAMGILYDWLFNVVTTTLTRDGVTLFGDAMAASVGATIRAQQQGFICGGGHTLLEDWTCDISPAIPDAFGGHAHQNNTETVAALLAMRDEHPELEPLIDTLRTSFVELYNPARAWIAVDGGFHMGWAYGSTYTYLDSIDLFTTTDDTPMLEDWQGKLIDRYIYGLRGDFQYPASGDYFSTGLRNEFVTGFALWAARDFGNAYAGRFFRDWILPNEGGRMTELLYWQPDLPEAPLEELPLARHFRNAGEVLIRDSWDYPSATLLELKSTSFWSINHHHLDQNSFTLFYKAPLLVDSGRYDAYGTSHWHNYYTRTIAHNTVTVWDPAEAFVRTWPTGSVTSNDGGQWFMTMSNPRLADAQPGGVNHIDGVTAFDHRDALTYVVGNASKAYWPEKLDQEQGFVRSLVFLRRPALAEHPVVLVYDRVVVQPGKEGLTKRFLLHTATEPSAVSEVALGGGHYQLGGTLVTVRNGGGALFVETLLPESATLTKIGGRTASDDYRFLVPDSSGVLQSYPPNEEPDPSFVDVGAWRIEVSPVPGSVRDDFLHILTVADDAPEAAPVAAALLPSDDAVVVLVGSDQVVAFSKASAPATQLQWQQPEPDVSVAVAGLEPSLGYTVTVSAATSGSLPYDVHLVADEMGTDFASEAGLLVLDGPLSLTVP